MALIKCGECGHAVSTKAKACPGCGAKPKTSAFWKAVLFVFLLLAGLSGFGVLVRPKASVDMLTVDATTGAKVRPELVPAASAAPAEAAAPVKVARPIEEDPPVKVPGSQWSYDESPDSMSKGKIRTATILSSNEVEFGFPYHGPQRATLMLRMHPRQGKDVLFRIERGQLLCPPFDDCQVLVRFDDEAAVHYSAGAPEDNSNETLFVENYPLFFEKLTKAKRVRISANVFQEGTRMFEFDVSGFDPARYKAESSKLSPR